MLWHRKLDHLCHLITLLQIVRPAITRMSLVLVRQTWGGTLEKLCSEVFQKC